MRFSTPAGEAWCALLRDAARDGHGPLPTAVWAVAARLRAGAGVGARALIAPTPAGPLRIEASPGVPTAPWRSC